MAFTTATVDSIERGNKQFQGAFKEMWAVTLTVDPSEVAAGAEDSASFTIPGIAFGDMVLGNSTPFGGLDGTWHQFQILQADTLVLNITNLTASTAHDASEVQIKVLIGRPSW